MRNSEMERLAERVRASARDGGLIETAQVKLIGLDDVREAAGARWPRMRDYVREGSIKIIAARIGPDDAVVACGDGFLVVFADAAADQARRKCVEVREALLSFYLGEEALAPLRANVEQRAAPLASLADMIAQTSAQDDLERERNKLALGRFWPIWSNRRDAIAAHICGPALDERGRPPFRMGYGGHFLERAVHRDVDFLDLDLCLLEQACAASERPGAGPVGVSVHATTLQNKRARRVYLDHVAANAAAIQHRMFVIIAEIEPGTPLISLSEWTSALTHVFSRVALEFHHRDRALNAIASAGVWAAGYQLPIGHGQSVAELRKSLTALDNCCTILRRQNIMPLISGFAHAGFLNLAKYGDLAFATGEALWPSTSDCAIVDKVSRAYIKPASALTPMAIAS